jgi:DNA-binding response OmpR family regulator
MPAPRLLIIDDDPAILELVKIGFEAKGFLVDEAETAAEARAKLEGGGFDLVLCDWVLPDVNGDQLLAWAKREPGLKEVPFVMVTAKDQKDYVVKAIRLGADGYIVKPFTIERLHSKIGGVLEKFQRSRAQGACNALVRYRNHSLRGAVRRLENERLSLRVARDAHFPRLLEQATVTLEKEGRVSAHPIRAQVTGLQMEDFSPGAEAVELTLRLHDLSDQNRKELARVRCLPERDT